MPAKGFTSKANSGGFTLVEIAIATAIMLCVTIVVVRFWSATSDAFILDSNMVTLKLQSEHAMEAMTDRLRRADTASITLSDAGKAIDFFDAFDGCTVRYELRPLAPTGPTWGRIVQIANGTESALTGYVEDLNFSASATGLVTMTATFHMGAEKTETRLSALSSVSARN